MLKPLSLHLIVILISVVPGSTVSAQKAYQSTDTSSIIQRLEKNRLNKPYPAFNFKSTSGTAFNSVLLRNKTIVIDCWFEGCHPCMAEVDVLNELHDSLRNNPDVVFFTVARERESDIERILEERDIRYPVVTVIDEAYKYNLNGGFPAKIIVDKNGLVAYYHGGGSPKKEAARKYVFGEFYPKILEIAKAQQ